MMTRKEPQFDDDLQKAIETPALIPQPQTESKPTPKVTPKSSNSWLLWVFVVVSLLASFGMAFFGLDEAGKYQAALTNAQEQSRQLEATIERLNETQAQGIGELAQSDAQMRKMVIAIERRIQNQLADRLTSLQTQVTEQANVLDATSQFVQKVDRAASETRTALKVNAEAVAENNKSLMNLNQQIAIRKSSIDETLALMGEQTNVLRGRLDQLAKARDAVISLANQLRELKAQTVMTERSVKGMEIAQDAIEQTVVSLEATALSIESELSQLEKRHTALANDTTSSQAMDGLQERIAGLENRLSRQNESLQSLNSSRKALNKRLIDLDARVLSISPKEQ